MARYTLELRTIYEDPNFKLFDFDYEFYDNALKSNFERKFFEHYYFDEIGFPTIQKFKHMLKAKLNLIMPYYKQLYNIEVQSINVDFLLQKDLKETFVREIENSSNMSGNISSNGNNNSENININSGKSKAGNGPFIDGDRSNQTHRDEIDFLLDAVSKIQKELRSMQK